MRKLKLQVQISIDGFIGGPNGSMDWLTTNWSDDISAYVTEITDSVDTILLGKNLAIGFIPHWKGVAEDPANPEQQAGKKFFETQKIVFSKTLQRPGWENTEVNNGPLREEVIKIKQQYGGDIIVYGGATFVSALFKENLIDELHLCINPVILGKGMAIFNAVDSMQHYVLKKSRQFDCGIALLKYDLKES
ncbi:MAG: dihydrofolate reductase [Chitinophagaceae bacterium]|nr:MAG: dihydrofolate reductase [Chitinophagaceae bacterium]